MKGVIDLQPAQGLCKIHGIGKYSLQITKYLLMHNTEYEFFVFLNDLYPEEALSIKKKLSSFLKDDHFILGLIPLFINYLNFYPKKNEIEKFLLPELIREYAIFEYQPDFILLTSLFELSVPTSIKKLRKDIPVALIFYDLIPYIFKKEYLKLKEYHDWYFYKLKEVYLADLIFAISENTKKDLINYLGISEDKIITCYAGCDERFKPLNITFEESLPILKKYKIEKKFIFYLPSSYDFRKNIDRLIQAYAQLPQFLRENFQLVIGSEFPEDIKEKLKNLAYKSGLKKNELVFTGYISEDDLPIFYNLCTLFVYPSLYEGFGLPVLEAMKCGAPVIASNTSSLPEVLQEKSALFDPKNINSISKKIYEVLTNKSFLIYLKENALKQASKFSWEKSAKIILSSLSELKKQKIFQIYIKIPKKPKLAYVSPMLPEKTRIAMYSKEFLPYLSKYYNIEIVVDQKEIDKNISSKYSIIKKEEFLKNWQNYDRILYHFGNSSFHKHMFEMLEIAPGVVVLHDVYLSHLISWMDSINYSSMKLLQEIYYSHGYTPLKEYFYENQEKVIWKYPINYFVLENSLGIIIHSQFSKNLIKNFYSNVIDEYIKVIPQFKEVFLEKVDSQKIKKELGFKENDFLICSFGILTLNKLPFEIIKAFRNSYLSFIPETKLIFVGEPLNDIKEIFNQLIEDLKLKDKVFITGFVDEEKWKLYLASADLVIQLRKNTRGEISRALLDALSFGKPVIVNTYGFINELPENIVFKIKENFSIEELSEALEKLYEDQNLRKAIGENAQKWVEENLSPQKIAKIFYLTIEEFYQKENLLKLFKKLKSIKKILHEEDVKIISRAIYYNTLPKVSQKQILIDISYLVKEDPKSGIQRMVKAQLRELLNNPPQGYRIEPIYLSYENGKWIYKYARKYTLNFLKIKNFDLLDEPVKFLCGDILYAPDPYFNITEVYQTKIYHKLKAKGIRLNFVVHDLLPIVFPKYFPEGTLQVFSSWLKTIVEIADKIICISKSVVEELKNYLKKEGINFKDLQITYLYHGADFKKGEQFIKDSEKIKIILEKFKDKKVFLMVSTIEPRKGHKQVLEAFEILWKKNYDFYLVFAGKQGWMVEELIEKMKTHPEKDKRFFLLGQVSDETLNKLYQICTCVIVASEGEGYGLPIIEASFYKKPLILRDIPVFREVAGDGAYYFENTKDSKILAQAIEDWFKLYKENKHPNSETIKWITWNENVKRLIKILTQ